MQREMFTPPGGPTYIPPEYVVYLSNDDDRDWQGEKRRGLDRDSSTSSPSARANRGRDAARDQAVRRRAARGRHAQQGRVPCPARLGRDRVRANTMVTSRPTPPEVRRGDDASAPAVLDLDGGDGERARSRGDARARAAAGTLLGRNLARGRQARRSCPSRKQKITIGRGSKSIEVDLPHQGRRRSEPRPRHARSR